MNTHRALSEVPNSKAVAGVRVGLIGGEFIVNPTVKEMEESQLDLFLAGTDSAILTIEVRVHSIPEFARFANFLLFVCFFFYLDSSLCSLQGYSNFLPEEMLVRAVKVGQVLHFLSEIIFNFLKSGFGTECETFLFFYQDAVQATCTAIEALAKKYGKPKMVDAIRLPPPELYKHVKVCFLFCFARM